MSKVLAELWFHIFINNPVCLTKLFFELFTSGSILFMDPEVYLNLLCIYFSSRNIWIIYVSNFHVGLRFLIFIDNPVWSTKFEFLNIYFRISNQNIFSSRTYRCCAFDSLLESFEGGMRQKFQQVRDSTCFINNQVWSTEFDLTIYLLSDLF